MPIMMTITQHQHQPQPQDDNETTSRLKKDLRLRASHSVARRSKTIMATTTTIQRIQAIPTTTRTTTKTMMTTTTTTTRTTYPFDSTTKRLMAMSQWFGLFQCVAVLVWSWTSPFVVQAFTTRTLRPHAPPPSRNPRFQWSNPSTGSFQTTHFPNRVTTMVPTTAAVRYQSSQRSSSRTRLAVSMSPPPHPGNGKSSSSSSSLLDEYDVIVLYPKSEIPFFLQETPTGQAAFAGYVQYDEPCSTIRNVGDVVVSIDGLSTQGLTIHKLVQLFQEKARNCAYSFVRFRSCVPGGGGAVAGSGGTVPSMPHGAAASSSSSSSSSLDPLGQLPGEQRRNQLELEIAHIDSQVQLKLTQVQTLQEKKVAKEREVRKLDQLDLDWIEQKKQELQASFDEDDDEDEMDRDEPSQQGASQDPSSSSKKPKTKSTTASSSSSPSFPNSWNPGSSAAKQPDPQPHFAFTNKQQPSGANNNNKPPSWPSAGGGGPPPPRSGP